MERLTNQTEKRMKALGKIRVNPSIKVTDNASSKIDKVKAKSDKLNKTVTTKLKVIDNASNTVDKVKSNTDKLNRTFTSKVKINDAASVTIDKIKSKSDDLNNKKSKVKVSASDTASEPISKVKSKAEELGNKKAKVKLEAKDEATNVINRAQNKINGWIKTGAKKIITIGLAGSVALGGLGIGSAMNTFTNFEYGMKTVQATSQATEKDLMKLTDTAKNLGAKTSFSAVEVSEGMNYLAMAGYRTEDIISAMPGLLDAAAASGEGLASTSDIISDAITAFGMKANDTTHLADVMAQAGASANTSIGLLGESFKYVGATAGAMGYSVEDASLALGLMANAGVKGSMGGTALKNAIVNMASPTDTMASVMEKYNLSLTDADGNMKSLKSVMDMLRSNMRGLDKATQSAAASQLFGKEAMSGMLSIINASDTDYNNLANAIYNADGAAKKMADTKLDSLSGQWTILKSAVEGMKIELGERLAPYAKEFVTWLTGEMPNITNGIVNTVDYISKHTDTIKSLAITLGSVGASIAVLSNISSIGNSINGVGKIIGLLKGSAIVGETTKIAGGINGIGLAGKLLPAIFSPVGAAVIGTVGAIGIAVKANSDLMKKSITTTVEELGPVQKIMNKFHGNIFKTEKEMKELGLVYDDFGEGVSKTFKNSVKEASKSILELQMNLNSLTYDGKVNEKEAESFNKWIGDFTTGAIDAINEKRSEIKTAFEKTFNLDGVISETEQGTLDCLDKFFDSGVKKEIEIRDQIYKIGSESIKEHGTIIDSDMKIIKEKLGELQALKLEYANAESAGERAYAQNKFKEDAEKVGGINEASKILKDRFEEHDKNIEEIEKNYDTTIEGTKHLINSNIIPEESKPELRNTLERLEKEKTSAINQEKQGKTSDLNTVYNAYDGAKGMINEYTGDALSRKDVDSQKAMNKIKEAYDGIEQITKSGNYRVYDSTAKTWKNLQVSIDEESGKMVGLYDSTTGKCGAYTTEMESELKKLGKTHTDLNTSTVEAMKSLSGAHVNSKGQIVSANNEIVASLDKRKISADGVYSGILKINGTEIKIQSDNSGAIINMNEVEKAVNLIPPSKEIVVNSNAKKTSSEVNELDDSINKVRESKTITFFKRIITTVEEVFESSARSRENKHDDFIQKQQNIGRRASGTNSSSAGLSTVDEKGWELSDRKAVPIIGMHGGNPLTYMSKGTKILNHMQSVNDMKREVATQIDNKMAYRQPHVKYQVAQAPQQQVAGIGGLNFGDINVNVESNDDIDTIVAEATKEVARKLKEALVNIKK